jgi:hypothetical protein
MNAQGSLQNVRFRPKDEVPGASVLGGFSETLAADAQWATFGILEKRGGQPTGQVRAPQADFYLPFAQIMVNIVAHVIAVLVQGHCYNSQVITLIFRVKFREVSHPIAEQRFSSSFNHDHIDGRFDAFELRH